MVRRALAMVVSLLCVAAFAQPVPPPPPPPPGTPPTYTRPPDTVPAPPPMPDASGGDAELEPQVTIIRRETETVEEVRVNGELRYIRVTPRWGAPYYLVPTGPGQAFQRFDSLGSGVRAPMWLLFSW